MNKEKGAGFTQGPWNESEGEIYRGNDPICDIVDYRGSEVDKANARLIASAPAMYDMLVKISQGNGYDTLTLAMEARELLANVDGGDEG